MAAGKISIQANDGKVAGVVFEDGASSNVTVTIPKEGGTLATKTGLSTKQDTLVSGTSIKTINSTSLLGSGNIVINEGINLATANSYDIGIGQSWQDVTGSRALGIAYTNSTGKPIMISVTNYWYNNNGVYDYITVNGVIVAKNGTDNSNTTTNYGQLTAIVPNGHTYSVTALKPFKHWAELR